MSKTLELSDDELLCLRMALNAWEKMLSLNIEDGRRVGFDHTFLKKEIDAVKKLKERIK